MSAAAEKARQVLKEKRQKQAEDSKKELKFLFGGLTEKQVDIAVIVILAILVPYFLHDKVDWELRVYPRSLGSFFVAPAPSGAAIDDNVKAIPRAHSLLTVASVASALEGLRTSGAKNASLILFHSELFDGNATRLVEPHPGEPKRFGISGATQPPGVTDPQAVLRAIADGSVTHVLWFLPSWSSVALGMESRVRCVVAPRVGDGSTLGVHCPHLYFALRGVAATAAELDMTRHTAFDMQVVAADMLYRRRTVAFLNAVAAVHFDLSFFSKRDVAARLLKAAGVDAQLILALRGLTSPALFCAETPVGAEGSLGDATATAGRAVRSAMTAALGPKQESILQPMDIFLTSVAPSLPHFCEARSSGERRWRELRAVYEALNATQQRVLRGTGLVWGAGVASAPSADALGADVASTASVITALNWPTATTAVVKATVSDEWLLRAADDEALRKVVAEIAPTLAKSLAAAGLVDSAELARDDSWKELLDPSVAKVALLPPQARKGNPAAAKK